MSFRFNLKGHAEVSDDGKVIFKHVRSPVMSEGIPVAFWVIKNVSFWFRLESGLKGKRPVCKTRAFFFFFF